MKTPSVEDVKHPNVWVVGLLMATVGGGGATAFSKNTLSALRAEMDEAKQQIETIWQVKASDSDVANIKEYVDLKIQAECRQ